MLARANDMHIRLLRAALTGQPLATSSWSPGSFRGARVATETLLRWGCLEQGKATERGEALVAAWDAKHPRGRAGAAPQESDRP